MTLPGPADDDFLAAVRLLNGVTKRVAVHEAVGIVQGWQGCDAVQALHELTCGTAAAGLDAEAERVAAVLDAQADGTADPDYGGWE